MKKQLVVLFWLASLTLAAQPQPGPYVIVDLMKVSQSKGAAYTKVEKEMWKPIHQARLKAGEILAWYVYAVDFAGEGSEYNYVTVTVMDKLSKLDVPVNYDTWIKSVHPKRTVDEFTKTTLDSRVIVRSILARRVAAATPAKAPEKPDPMLAITYYKAHAGKEDTYSNMVKSVFIPVTQELANQGKDSGSAFWEMWYPSDKAADYNFTFTHPAKSWAETEEDNGYAAAWKKVNPNLDATEFQKMIQTLRERTASEVWWLIDYVQ